jgi:hypothetical protein
MKKDLTAEKKDIYSEGHIEVHVDEERLRELLPIAKQLGEQLKEACKESWKT